MAVNKKYQKLNAIDDTPILRAEPTDRDEAYRSLAVSIVIGAVNDYIRYLAKPNYDEEVKRAKTMTIAAQAIYEAMKQMGEDQAEEVQSYLLNAISKAKDSGMYVATQTGRGRMGVWEMERRLVERPMTLAELLNIGRYFYLSTKVMLSQKEKKNWQRKKDKMDVEAFFKSEAFALYTGDLIDPVEVMEHCKQIAKNYRGEELDVWFDATLGIV